MGRSCESHGPKTAILKDVTNHSNGYSTDMSVYLHVVACMYIYIYIIIVEIHSKYIYIDMYIIWLVLVYYIIYAYSQYMYIISSGWWLT